MEAGSDVTVRLKRRSNQGLTDLRRRRCCIVETDALGEAVHCCPFSTRKGKSFSFENRLV
jgi:hypothetical protein